MRWRDCGGKRQHDILTMGQRNHSCEIFGSVIHDDFCSCVLIALNALHTQLFHAYYGTYLRQKEISLDMIVRF